MESNYSSGPGPAGPNQGPPSYSSKFQTLSGWGTFVGVMMILFGVLNCIWIIGAIFGIPFIIAGIKLLTTVDSSQNISGSNSDYKVNEVFRNINTYLKITGIAIILMVTLFLILIIIGMATGMSTMFNNGNFGEFK